MHNYNNNYLIFIRFIVVCEDKIYVFNLISFQNIDTLETFSNPKGIVAVSSDPKITVIAYPDKTKGYVRVKSYGKFAKINLYNFFI
jgi:hypothetical protein